MIKNYNSYPINQYIYTEIKPTLTFPDFKSTETFLSAIRRISEVAFSIFSDILILPGAGLLLFWMLFCPSFDPIFIKKDKIPILLLHGSGFNESQWIIGRWLLNKQNYGSIFSVSYDCGLITNDPKQGIDDCALGKVRDKILKIQNLTGQKEIVLIGHSMGGLVASCYAEYLAKKDQCKIRHVISIGSPWQGTPIIKQCLGGKQQEKRYLQMSPNNSFRENLIRDALRSEKMGRRTYYTIGSKSDFIVPFPCSVLSEGLAHQYNVSSLGHFGIVVFPQIWNKINLWLEKIYETTSSKD